MTAPPALAASQPWIAVGDIASCSMTEDSATSALVSDMLGPIATLGDTAYTYGSWENFNECWVPSWGMHNPRIRPAVGNHEYYQPGAGPYFEYFGAAAGAPQKGWYSYEVGDWHVVTLNSNCQQVGCGVRSEQWRWLYNDLKNNPGKCTAAVFHHPLYSAGLWNPFPEVRPFWELLYLYGADLVLVGHDHNYQRFAPQNPWGRADAARGMRQITVGTGGARIYGLRADLPPNFESGAATFGVLGLTLDAAAYSWDFKPIPGETFTDSGSASCIDAPPHPTPSLGITAENLDVTYGSWSTASDSWARFSGQAKTTTGSPLRGAKIYIQRYDGSAKKWVWVASASADSNGYYSKRFQPYRSGYYRSVAQAYSAMGLDRATASGSKKVITRYRATLGLSDTSLEKGQWVKISGIVRPWHASGKAYIQWYDAGRKQWRYLGTAKIKNSTYEYWYKPAWKGKWSFRAHIAPDSDHYANFTPSRSVWVGP